MDSIFSFEYPPVGVIRIIVMDSHSCSFYFAVKDFVPFLSNQNLKALKGCLFHGDLSLREQIVPVEEVLPVLRVADTDIAKDLAARLDRDVIPQVRLLCCSHCS